MHAFANILIKEKYRLKIKHFFIKVGIKVGINFLPKH